MRDIIACSFNLLSSREIKSISFFVYDACVHLFLGNAVAAAISFGIETIILTVRVLIYHFSSEEKREIYLARDWVITWDDYVKRMTQAGLANLAAFGFSVLGLLVGVAFGGVGAIPLSIIFGLIGYIGTRWLTGIVYDKVRQRVGLVSKYNW